MKNICVAQSGGPTAAINASLKGIITAATAEPDIDIVYGAKYGISGVQDDNLINLSEYFNISPLKSMPVLSLPLLSKLRHTPASALGSCRKKLPDPFSDKESDKNVFEKIFSNLKKYNIGCFFYIGGNDSMDTVLKLSKYAEKTEEDIKFIGIPKTIDNDLPETDHTPGFGSAAKYLCVTMSEIARDSAVYDIPSVTIVEIMGRDSGWLTASSILAREISSGAPQLIYLPEHAFDINHFFNDIRSLHKNGKKTVLAAVSEGLKDKAGNYVAAGHLSGKIDTFGHSYLAGLGKFLENKVTENIGCKVRSIELSVCQRCASHIGSTTDLDEAQRFSENAVRAYKDGKSGVMMSIVRISSEPYIAGITTVSIEDCANKVKKFPSDWITKDGNDIVPEAISYFLPLIQGEENIEYSGGLPSYITL